jgi:hypothetical protein
MPFKLINTEAAPLFIDYEYEIIDKKALAEYVGEIVLGNHFHILKVINSLATNFPLNNDNAIDNAIERLSKASPEKRDGWLFQMISWVVLGIRFKGEPYFSNSPHFAPAQHGIDGLAIVLNKDGTLKSIIITEDKCTENPRNLITQQVFPEFKDFEDGKKDNALISIIAILIGHLETGKIYENAQNNIYNNDYRVYRIGITREAAHNDQDGRKSLFKDYENNVKGADHNRRSGATIFLNDMRVWMDDFSNIVISYLKSKKSKDV